MCVTKFSAAFSVLLPKKIMLGILKNKVSKHTDQQLKVGYDIISQGDIMILCISKSIFTMERKILYRTEQ